jgi:signal transduction histidine kinase
MTIPTALPESKPLTGMDRLVTTVQELSLARDMDSVTRIVRKVARELTGADGATFILRDNDHCFYADEDAIGPLWKGQRFPMHACISGWAMLNRQSTLIEDIYADDRIPTEAYKPTFVKSLAMVPIRTIDPIGAIGNYWSRHYTPSAEEIKLLQALADITAVTIENVKVYAELEQRVKDRTEELEEIIKELEAFSYSVSHDLRAPLRAISFYIDMLREDHSHNLTDEGKKIAGKVSTKATEMGQLINDLLAFFRLGRKELEKTNFPVTEMVKTIIEEMTDQTADRIIDISIGELPEINGDPVLLKQVWINLISNAIKYTRNKNKATISIGAVEQEGCIVYRIVDNGVGFDMKYYDKLFGVLHRLHAQSEFEGTGIGLAIVERIVTRHGGKVWAEAKPGEGASFYFSLPK